MNTNLSLIRERGLEILVQEMGAADAVQFIRQFENGSGDYTEDRRETLKDITIEDIVSSIAERKKNAANKTF